MQTSSHPHSGRKLRTTIIIGLETLREMSLNVGVPVISLRYANIEVIFGTYKQGYTKQLQQAFQIIS